MPTRTASCAVGCSAPEGRTKRKATWMARSSAMSASSLRIVLRWASARLGARSVDLPTYVSPMPDRIRTRFLVVGSGVAGLHTAWRASQYGEVIVLTKRSLFDSATAYAQGGIAAALGAGDSPELHRIDTLAAGAALADAAAVQVLVEE